MGANLNYLIHKNLDYLGAKQLNGLIDFDSCFLSFVTVNSAKNSQDFSIHMLEIFFSFSLTLRSIFERFPGFLHLI